jgi:hypothetical protein
VVVALYSKKKSNMLKRLTVNLLLDAANVEWNSYMRKIDCITYSKKKKGK